MGKIANRLMRIPRAVVEYAGAALRGSVVYLTIFVIVGSAWTAAWSRSLDRVGHRVMMPAFRREELPESARAEFDEGARAEADDEPAANDD